VVDPRALASSALDSYGQRASDQEGELRAMLAKIRDLRATFEGGRLTVHLDREATLELIEARLKRSFAKEEAGMTATFRRKLDSTRDTDLDGELRLGDRSIYVKFAPKGTPVAEFAISCLERARKMGPSELWLITLGEEKLDIAFEPTFLEKKIIRGRLRTLGLTTVFREMVGEDCDVLSMWEDGGFEFRISKREKGGPAPRYSDGPAEERSAR